LVLIVRGSPWAAGASTAAARRHEFSLSLAMLVVKQQRAGVALKWFRTAVVSSKHT
jgi:hypothetical protein